MQIFEFDKEYTRTPYARNKEHDNDRNGEDFERKYLSQWLQNKKVYLRPR